MRQSHMRPSTMSKLPKAHRKFTDTGTGLSLNIKFICTRYETGLKSSPKARYSACF